LNNIKKLINFQNTNQIVVVFVQEIVRVK
jgi:hypothetical protein